MKKIVLLHDSERMAFRNYCKAIESMETDKDTFLKASRLERHESKLSGEQVYWLKITGIWACVLSLVIVSVTAVMVFGS